jgi:hypothetical protein
VVVEAAVIQVVEAELVAIKMALLSAFWAVMLWW